MLKTNSTNEEEIKINTLEGLFFSEEGKNDISCEFQNRFLILVEHQSTINENMPLRCLFYVTELYKKIISTTKNKIFQPKSIIIPRPEFFVLYNGKKKVDDILTLKLSDSFAFGFDIKLELIVHQFNINEGFNENLIKNCPSLNEFCKFMNRMKENILNGMTIEDALRDTSEFCLKNDIMVDFILKYRQELKLMYWFAYDKKAAELAEKENFEKELIEREKEVEKRSRAEEKISMVKNLIKVGTPIEFIQKATGWSEEEIFKLARQN